jgi:putative heme-binding domain-containing protein
VKNVTAVILLACAGTVCAQEKVNPYARDGQAAEVGKGVFRIYCSPCHGIRAQGGKGPDLTRGTYAVGDSDADLYKIIADGRPGTDMPANGSFLGNEGVWRIVSFIRSVAKPSSESVSGDAAAGEQVFWGKGGCGKCHAVGSRGGKIGPELTLIGRSRSAKYLRDSLTDPDLDIADGYARIEVTLRDGKKVSGVERNSDFFSAQFLDAQERYHSYTTDEVMSISRTKKSFMPAYGKALTVKELDDLVAYMSQLGRRQ